MGMTQQDLQNLIKELEAKGAKVKKRVTAAGTTVSFVWTDVWDYSQEPDKSLWESWNK